MKVTDEQVVDFENEPGVSIKSPGILPNYCYIKYSLGKIETITTKRYKKGVFKRTLAISRRYQMARKN